MFSLANLKPMMLQVKLDYRQLLLRKVYGDERNKYSYRESLFYVLLG